MGDKAEKPDRARRDVIAEVIEEGLVIDQPPSGTRPSAELYRALEPAKPNRAQRRAKPKK